MDIQLTATVSSRLHGSRLDAAAACVFPDYSRSQLCQWIKCGRLLLDGRIARPRDKVSTDNCLTLLPDHRKKIDWLAEPIPLKVVFEDEHVIVLNKPAGLVVHPAAGHSSGTLVNGLLAHAPEMAKLPRSGIVHRLDKDTSGLMFAARSSIAHQSLVKQLSERSVKRVYLAICRGALTGGGTIDAPIGRHPTSRIRMAVIEAGKPAITHYTVSERFANHTRLAVSLESGRTHQIRVHLSWRKYPLVGDPIYGGRDRPPAGASQSLLSALTLFKRQALHSQHLEFEHPASGKRLEFSCQVPNDLCTLLSVLKAEDSVE